MHQGQENFCVIGQGDTDDTLALLRKLFPGRDRDYNPDQFMGAFFRPQECNVPTIFRLTPGRFPAAAIAQDRTIFIVASPAKREEIIKELLRSGILADQQNIVIYRQSHEKTLPRELTDKLSKNALVYLDGTGLEGMIEYKRSFQKSSASSVSPAGPKVGDEGVIEIDQENPGATSQTASLGRARQFQARRARSNARAKCCYTVGFFASGATAAGGLGVGGAAIMGFITLPATTVIGLVAGSVLIALALLMLSLLSCRRVKSSLEVERRIAGAQFASSSF